VHRLKVHIAAVHCKGRLWDSNLSLITEVRFTSNCYS